MPYRYLEDIATADIAFEAWGATLEETFVAAADATMNVMVEELDSIAPIQRRTIDVSAEEIDMLLFETLQELIFYKDADTLLLRVSAVRIRKEDDTFFLSGDAYGEEIMQYHVQTIRNASRLDPGPVGSCGRWCEP